MNMIVSGAVIAAAAPVLAEASENDAELFRLEEQIFQEHAAATEYGDGRDSLHDAFEAEFDRHLDEARATGALIGRNKIREVWDQARAAPVGVEMDRLEDLQAPHLERMEKLIEKMWATPARTPEGRRAKLLVLLGCVLEDRWRDGDWAADWDIKLTRDLLIEFVGGEPAEQLRDQFA